MEMFTPTLDWGNELWTSLVWIARGWAIAAVCTLVVLVLIAGSPRGAGSSGASPATTSPVRSSVKVWLWLARILLSVIVGVRLDVLFSYQGNDMMTSLQVVAAGHSNWRRSR